MGAHQPSTGRPGTTAGPGRAPAGFVAAMGALLLAGCTQASAGDVASPPDGLAATVADLPAELAPTEAPTDDAPADALPTAPPVDPSVDPPVDPTEAPTVVPTPTASPTGLPTGGPTTEPSPLPSASACPGLGEGEDPRDVVEVSTGDGDGTLRVTVALRGGLALPDVCAYPFGLSSWVWVAPAEGGAPVPVLLAHDEGVLAGGAALVLDVTTGCPGRAVLRTGTEVGEVPLPDGDPRVVVALATDDGCPPAGGVDEPTPVAPATAGAPDPVAAPAGPPDDPAGRPDDPADALVPGPAARLVGSRPVDPVVPPVAPRPAPTAGADAPAAAGAPDAAPAPPSDGAVPAGRTGASASTGAPATGDAAEDDPEASPTVTTEGALPPDDGSAAPDGGASTPGWAVLVAGALALVALGTTVALARAGGSGRHSATT